MDKNNNKYLNSFFSIGLKLVGVYNIYRLLSHLGVYSGVYISTFGKSENVLTEVLFYGLIFESINGIITYFLLFRTEVILKYFDKSIQDKDELQVPLNLEQVVAVIIFTIGFYFLMESIISLPEYIYLHIYKNINYKERLYDNVIRLVVEGIVGLFLIKLANKKWIISNQRG